MSERVTPEGQVACPECGSPPGLRCENLFHLHADRALEDWTTVQRFAEAMDVDPEAAKRCLESGAEMGFLQRHDNDITAVKYRLPKGDESP